MTLESKLMLSKELGCRRYGEGYCGEVCWGSRRLQEAQCPCWTVRTSECSVSEQLTCEDEESWLSLRGNSKGDAECDHPYGVTPAGRSHCELEERKELQ